jgi:hypothetical protein
MANWLTLHLIWGFEMLRKFLGFLAIIFLFGCVGLLAQIIPSPTIPPNDPTQVTIDAQAALFENRGACVALLADTPINAWSVAPSEITDASVLSTIRYVSIQNVTESGTPFASELLGVVVGGAAPSALTEGVRVFSGGTYQPQIRRPNSGATVGGVWPNGPVPIWLYASDALTACVVWSR